MIKKKTKKSSLKKVQRALKAQKQKPEIFDPELGQMCFGNPWGEYGLPEFVSAMMLYIKDEIKRIHWKVQDTTWESDHEGPKIPGIEWRPYCWDENSPAAKKPNFKYKDVEIRWYKYFDRNMSCNKQLMAQEWVNWFDELMAYLRIYEAKHDHLSAIR